MSKTYPTVDIAIPAYKPIFFEQSLKSAIGQTYPHIKIYVSDDCPTDEIQTICSKYPQIEYFKNSNPGGLNNIINSIARGKGHLIKPLFDDDILHPFCVERMVNFIDPLEEVSLIFSASAHIDINNNKTHLRRPFTENKKISSVELQKAMIRELRNFIGEFSTVLFRRRNFELFPGMDLFRFQDEFFLKGLSDVVAFWNLTSSNSAFYIDEELSYFRTGDEHQSNSNIKTNPNFKYAVTDWIDLAILINALYPFSPEELKECKKHIEVLVAHWEKQIPEIHTKKEVFWNQIKGEKNLDSMKFHIIGVLTKLFKGHSKPL